MSKKKTMKQRCAERPLHYMPKGDWWLLTNHGIPWGAYTTRRNAISSANRIISGTANDAFLPDNCELRRASVKVRP